jgi:NAD(P)-dependent dehydrogenase (short-subunit alcohol dehydrogenase family)
MTASRAALVTGCSSGIGRATALRLHARGLPVYASARRVQTLADLADLGITTLHLDVTDDGSMRAAVKRVVEEHGAVGVLVNNAGYALAGAVEDTPAEAWRAQFETNVFGPVRLTQLVLPGMRQQGWGRIVNISSIRGKAAPPGGGAYDASKHALEALSDALRLETERFGVATTLVEPGPVRSALAAATVATMAGEEPVYAEFRQRLAEWYGAVYGPGRPNLVGRFTVASDAVARVVERAVFARRPRPRYPVGPLAHGFLAMRRLLPDRAFDQFVRARFPVP